MTSSEEEMFTCESCEEEFPCVEMANPDRHMGMQLCGWCTEAAA